MHACKHTGKFFEREREREREREKGGGAEKERTCSPLPI